MNCRLTLFLFCTVSAANALPLKSSRTILALQLQKCFSVNLPTSPRLRICTSTNATVSSSDVESFLSANKVLKGLNPPSQYLENKTVARTKTENSMIGYSHQPTDNTPSLTKTTKQTKDQFAHVAGRRVMSSPMSYDSTIKVLKAYHAIHGDLVIPRRYIVPHSQDFPEEWHGVDLDNTVYNMRWWLWNVRSKPDRVAELNSLGFVWGRLQQEWNLVLEALIVYYSIHGHVLVPASFVVPHKDDVWPKATWGITLGNCVHRIRTRHDFLKGDFAFPRRTQLDGLGFVWDVSEHSFQTAFRALRHYAKLQSYKLSPGSPKYKTFRVPSTFVVPSGKENEWPEDLWGYSLGRKCSDIRQKQLYVKDNPERRKALDELGFQWVGNASLGWLEVVHAAAIYSKIHERNLDVPFNFVVPAPQQRVSNEKNACCYGDAWPWPEQLWGFPLGQRLKDVRLKGAYLKGGSANLRKAQLDTLGFNWTPKRGRKKRPLGGNEQAL